MKSIYGSATVVRVWLGEEADGSSDTMWFLEQTALGNSIGKLRRDNMFGQKHLWNLIAFSEKTLVKQSLGLTGDYSRQRSHNPRWEEFFQRFHDQQFVESRKLHERSYYRHAPE